MFLGIDFKPYSEIARLVDTGANNTTIPFINQWDTELLEYKINQKDKNKSILEYLNSNIENTMKTNVTTGTGYNSRYIIKWKSPIIYSIGNLPPIKLKTNIAPSATSGKTCVIGMDFLKFFDINFFCIEDEQYCKISSAVNFRNIRDYELNTFDNDISIFDNLEISTSTKTKSFFGIFNGKQENFEINEMDDDIIRSYIENDCDEDELQIFINIIRMISHSENSFLDKNNCLTIIKNTPKSFLNPFQDDNIEYNTLMNFAKNILFPIICGEIDLIKSYKFKYIKDGKSKIYYF